MDHKSEIDNYFIEYAQIKETNPESLTREDRYPFADLILREEFKKYDASLGHVYKKVVLLNSLYSTNIYATFDVALKIYKITNFEDRIKSGDISLVDEIRKNVISGQEKDFYSFATKYCHNHNPNTYPIYDSFVEDMLIYYLDEEEPNKRYYRTKMKDYQYFKDSLDYLAKLWSLTEDYKYERLDKFLWKKGKELDGQ